MRSFFVHDGCCAIIAIIDMLRLWLPNDCVVHHSPNKGRHKVQYRAKQKQLGVQAGWPDLEVIVPRKYWKCQDEYAPIFLEVKTAKGRISGNQRRVHKRLIEAGAEVHIVRSIEDVLDVFTGDQWALR